MKFPKSFLIIMGLFLLSGCEGKQKQEQQAFEAVYAGNVQKLIVLVNQGVSINASDGEGNSLLMLAAWYNKPNIVQWLLEHGATIDKEYQYAKTALIYASDQGYAPIVRLLLESGADINKVDRFSTWKPLDYAAAREHEDVIKTMLRLKDTEISNEDRQNASTKTNNKKIKDLLLQDS